MASWHWRIFSTKDRSCNHQPVLWLVLQNRSLHSTHSRSMEIFIGKQEGSRWEAVWDQIIRVCSWGISRKNFRSVHGNKTSPVQKIYRRHRWCHPRKQRRGRRFCDLRQRLSSQPQLHLGHFRCAAAFPRPLLEANREIKLDVTVTWSYVKRQTANGKDDL